MFLSYNRNKIADNQPLQPIRKILIYKLYKQHGYMQAPLTINFTICGYMNEDHFLYHIWYIRQTRYVETSQANQAVHPLKEMTEASSSIKSITYLMKIPVSVQIDYCYSKLIIYICKGFFRVSITAIYIFFILIYTNK